MVFRPDDQSFDDGVTEQSGDDGVRRLMKGNDERIIIDGRQRRHCAIKQSVCSSVAMAEWQRRPGITDSGLCGHPGMREVAVFAALTCA
jgi:hypothetical protein